MGTNYYLEAKPACECCKRPFDRKHIGKSSAGWVFSLHVYPNEGISDLPDWWKIWNAQGAEIANEYGETVGAQEMLSIVLARMGRADKPDSQWLAENQASPGPFGLARHQIGRGCIGHGSGTYDLCIGDYS